MLAMSSPRWDRPRVPVTEGRNNIVSTRPLDSRRLEAHHHPPQLTPSHQMTYSERAFGFPESLPFQDPWAREVWSTHVPPSSSPWTTPATMTGNQPHRPAVSSWPGLPHSLRLAEPSPNVASRMEQSWITSTGPSRNPFILPAVDANPKKGNPIIPSDNRQSLDQRSLKREGSGSRHSMDGYPVAIEGGSSPPGRPALKKSQPKRRSSNRDEFDGPHQLIDQPMQELPTYQESDLLELPTSLLGNEQDDLLSKVNDCLAQCAFDFVAKYQFPIPIEPDKRRVATPSDREWTEWVHLLKRLATKRRVPARVLYNGQIKQFVTVLENSLEMRHAAKHQSRPLKDDRNILQLVSAGTQVAKILKDAPAMVYLDQLYRETEITINSRKGQAPIGTESPRSTGDYMRRPSPSK